AREALGGACPYRGLLAFQPEDHDLYFGREQLVADLLAQLVDGRMLVVVGASGSGKSSLVRAGLIAALQHGAVLDSATWTIRIVTPGSDPLRALSEIGGGGLDGTTRPVILVGRRGGVCTNSRDAERRVGVVHVPLCR